MKPLPRKARAGIERVRLRDTITLSRKSNTHNAGLESKKLINTSRDRGMVIFRHNIIPIFIKHYWIDLVFRGQNSRWDKLSVLSNFYFMRNQQAVARHAGWVICMNRLKFKVIFTLILTFELVRAYDSKAIEKSIRIYSNTLQGLTKLWYEWGCNYSRPLNGH